MRIIDSLFVSARLFSSRVRDNERMRLIVSDHCCCGELLQQEGLFCSTPALIKAVLFSPEVLGFGYICLSLFWSCFFPFSFIPFFSPFLSCLPPSLPFCFFNFLASLFFHSLCTIFFFHSTLLLPPVLFDRTDSICRCRPECLHQPWAACCWRSCRGKKGTGTGEAEGKAAGEERLWSAPDGKKEATGCCLTCRPTVVLPGICGTLSTWPASRGVGIGEEIRAQRGGRIRGKKKLWRSSPLVSCAPPLPSPLSSSWALTPSASPRSCGLPSALLHHCQHCSGSWDIPCLQIRSTLSEAPLDCWPTGRSDASQSASTSGMLCSWLAARSLRQPWWGRTWHWFRTWWTVTTNQTDMSCLLRDNIWPGICTDVSHTTDKTTSSLKLQRNMLWSSSI